jgi:hypothetical protein
MPKHCTNLDCPALERDGVPAEYLDSISQCGECGSPLAAGERPSPAPPEFQELVTAYVASDRTVAYLIRSALEAEGIPASLAGEHLAGAVGELPATVLQVAIQVPPEHAKRAREIALEIGR